MSAVAAFIIGLLGGALLAAIAIICGYGKDADDYYEGSEK